MAEPTLLVRYSTDDADDPTPTWTTVTSYVRAFSTSRGRSSELSRVDAGTATIVLNNRTRQFDPTSNALLRPMNRWNLRAVLPNGTTEDIFLGYAESYEQQWPGVGQDAVTVVNCADEFKMLAQDQLPSTDPPCDTYEDLIMFDTPAVYWPMVETEAQLQQGAKIGEPLNAVNGLGQVTGAGAIVGHEPLSYAFLTGTGYLRTAPVEAGHALDPGGLTEFSAEMWLSVDGGLPAAAESLFRGPTAGASTWSVELRTDGKIDVNARNSGGTVHTVTSTTALTNNGPFYHIVATITGGNLRIYINGTQEASTAFAGSFAAVSTASSVTLGNNGSTIGARSRDFDEVAWYRYGLPAARVTAHYDAGVSRGFVRNQNPGDRIDDVLDAAGSVAARSVQTGTHNMTGAYMKGQPPLEELRKAETAESIDAVLFIAKDGTITFLADGHRSSSPYNTVQATFDDDGSGLPYTEIDVDYSDSFIANEWNVTKVTGTLTTSSDATSISKFGKRSQSLTDLPIIDDADVTAISSAMLAKYKDPIFRVTSLTVMLSSTAASNTVPTLDIGDRIRVFRTQLNGGRIDQTLFVQRIAVEGTPFAPWRVTLGVSPL